MFEHDPATVRMDKNADDYLNWLDFYQSYFKETKGNNCYKQQCRYCPPYCLLDPDECEDT